MKIQETIIKAMLLLITMYAMTTAQAVYFNPSTDYTGNKFDVVVSKPLKTKANKKFEDDFRKELTPGMLKLSEAYVESVKMCKICTEKAQSYKETMKDDEYAQATLDIFLRKLNFYCGSFSSAIDKIRKEK